MESRRVTEGVTMSIETAISILRQTIENRQIKYYFRTTYNADCNRIIILYICEYYSKYHSNCVPLAEFTHEWRADRVIDELYKLRNDVTAYAITELIQRYNGKDLYNFNQFWERFQHPIQLLKEYL